MEVSDQLHVPVALPPNKDLRVLTRLEAWWGPEPVWTLWGREKFLASAGNRTPTIHSVACRYTDWDVQWINFSIHILILWVLTPYSFAHFGKIWSQIQIQSCFEMCKTTRCHKPKISTWILAGMKPQNFHEVLLASLSRQNLTIFHCLEYQQSNSTFLLRYQ
jgi:hypothetical protein